MKLYDGREKFYQYDTNQKLICEDCSVGEEVHFSNGAHSDAAICLTYDLDGVVVVNVPNLYLLSAVELNVYSMRTEDDGRCTISRHVFGVVPRKKPSDYVYEETEVKSYAELDRRIKKLEENDGAGIDIVGAAAGQIPQIAEVDGNGAPTVWQPADLPKVEIPPLKVNLTKDADGEFTASHSASEIIAYAEKGGRVYLTALNLMYMGEYYQNTAKPGGNKSGAQFRYWGINPTGVAENLCYISEDKRLTQTSNAFAVAAMTGATADTAGAAGYVPAPAAGDEGKYLRGDGTWGEIDIPEGGSGGDSLGDFELFTEVVTDNAETSVFDFSTNEAGQSLADKNYKEVFLVSPDKSNSGVNASGSAADVSAKVLINGKFTIYMPTFGRAGGGILYVGLIVKDGGLDVLVHGRDGFQYLPRSGTMDVTSSFEASVAKLSKVYTKYSYNGTMGKIEVSPKVERIESLVVTITNGYSGSNVTYKIWGRA